MSRKAILIIMSCVIAFGVCSPVYAQPKAKIIALSISYYGFNYALKDDGTVWTWDKGKATQIKGLKNIVKVVAGWSHTIALDMNGDVWTFGMNDVSQLGNRNVTPTSDIQKPDLKDIVDVGIGFKTSYALGKDGRVWVWGANVLANNLPLEVPVTIPGVTNVKAVAGGDKIIMLKKDGTISMYPGNSTGASFIQDGKPVYKQDGVLVESNFDYSYFLFNTFIDFASVDQVKKLQKITKIWSDGSTYYAYRSNGQIWRFTSYHQEPRVAEDETQMIDTYNPKIKEISSKTDDLTVYLYYDGTVKTSALSNEHTYFPSDGPYKGKEYRTYVLGIGRVNTPLDLNHKKRYVVKGLKNIVDVASNLDGGYALDSSGNVWGWGDRVIANWKSQDVPAILPFFK
ncbi:RCC1 domain-containing protein [Bacillus sp. FJAT-28004]|uniref:RCC1 domain-containing protein n=1 Tax=Bacillus sp. FJAT-28004 TaxID=1679165 RepID=UPI0006B418E9|nr:hypothetical protein [Bacillus sp. FJAT-28004]